MLLSILVKFEIQKDHQLVRINKRLFNLNRKVSDLNSMLMSNMNPEFEERGGGLGADFLDRQYNMSASNPDVYEFSGNSYSIAAKGRQLTSEQLSRYRLITINIVGTMIKSMSMCCFWNTIIWGSIFVFPFFFMCCDWWKKKAYKLFNIQQSAYEGVAQIIRNSSAQQCYLKVQDNYFNEQKANVLIKSLQRSSVKNFVFSNTAMGFNTQENNYKKFSEYWREAKSLHINLDITWGGKFLS